MSLIAIVETLNAGYDVEKQKMIDLGIKVGDRFIVCNVDMGQSNTSIHLEEHSGSFNSVFFNFEKNGEKIDIIPWSENPKELVSNALSPAKVLSIDVDEKEHKAVVEVSDDQLSLAIGKGGQNVRLAAKLTGWRIDIKGNGGVEFKIETRCKV